MAILKINLRHPSFSILQQAVSVLRASGVIVYPTDTAYALGGIFNRPEVIRQVLSVKGPARRGNRKFTLIASSLAQVEKFFPMSPAQRKLARRFWPGPLSIAVNPKYAVRVPDCKIARELARRVGAPLIATSANRSGGATPYSITEVIRQLNGRPQPDLLLDAGRLKKQKPSTVVRVDGRGKVEIIRAGAVNVQLTQ